MDKRLQRLAALHKKINKKHGANTVGIASKMNPLYIERLTTGSLAFDFALGGGIPVSRITILWGQKESMKSTTAYRIAAYGQTLCANCLRPAKSIVNVEHIDEETGEVFVEAKGECDCDKGYEEFRVALFDVEGTYSLEWGELLGVDNDRLFLQRPDTAEELIDIYDSVLRSGAVDLLILDSIAAMTPSKEVEESAEDWQQGLAARLVNKFVRKVGSATNAARREYGRAPTQIWINQPRQKIGIAFGDNTILPGGKGQMFASSVEVKLWTSSWEKDTVFEDFKGAKKHNIEFANSVYVNFEIKKNKTAPSRGSGKFRVLITGDAKGKIDELDFIIAMCEQYGYIGRVKGKWVLGGEGGEEYKTKGELIERLKDPLVFDTIRRKLLQLMLSSV